MTRIIALGPGDPDAVPAAALAAIDALAALDDAHPAVIVGPPLGDALREAVGVTPAPMPNPLPDGVVVVATDAEAHAIAMANPGAHTLPARDAL
ncbi:MAG: hypothetical protein FJW78_05050, partial [Actinobacteria bacterium]|nr:hypothetical protein [Actinomycetota bacterium]